MANINLITKFFPLAFLLYLFPPRVEVDGGPPQKISWGQSLLQVAPGQHHLTVYFPYMFIVPKAGKAEIDVTVQEGQTVTVTYKAPWLVFLAGRVAIA
jgi:hypothetical protein